MILAAGLLVLVGLGLFVAGIATGATVLYWLCVVACGAAGVLLFLAWRTMKAGAAPGAEPRTATVPAEARTAERPPTAGQSVGESATPAAGTPEPEPSTTEPSTTEPSTTEPAQSVAAAGATAASVADAPAEAAGSTGAAGAPAEPAAAPATTGAPTSGAAHAHGHRGGSADGEPLPGEPPLEEVEVTDLLLVVDLRDEVLVVDEHPRYHLAGCRWLTGRETIPLPIDEARTDGFTPCGICEPDRHLADLERSRKAARRTS